MGSSDIYDVLLGPQIFRTWARENEIWRITYRTNVAGEWDDEDKAEWEACKIKYIFKFDHTQVDDASTVVNRILERDKFFKAAKVGKLAIDGIKDVILVGRDRTKDGIIRELVTELGYEYYGCRGVNEKTEQERHFESAFAEYISCVKRAFKPMGESDGAVRVTDIS